MPFSVNVQTCLSFYVVVMAHWLVPEYCDNTIVTTVILVTAETGS